MMPARWRPWTGSRTSLPSIPGAGSCSPCVGRTWEIPQSNRKSIGWLSSVPPKNQRGQEANVRVEVLGDDGRPFAGVQPVVLEVSCPTGWLTEWTGSYLASQGLLEVPIRPARNHPEGLWTIRVREVSSSRSAEAKFQVQVQTPTGRDRKAKGSASGPQTPIGRKAPRGGMTGGSPNGAG